MKRVSWWGSWCHRQDCHISLSLSLPPFLNLRSPAIIYSFCHNQFTSRIHLQNMDKSDHSRTSRIFGMKKDNILHERKMERKMVQRIRVEGRIEMKFHLGMYWSGWRINVIGSHQVVTGTDLNTISISSFPSLIPMQNPSFALFSTQKQKDSKRKPEKEKERNRIYSHPKE